MSDLCPCGNPITDRTLRACARCAQELRRRSLDAVQTGDVKAFIAASRTLNPDAIPVDAMLDEVMVIHNLMHDRSHGDPELSVACSIALGAVYLGMLRLQMDGRVRGFIENAASLLAGLYLETLGLPTDVKETL